MYWRVSWRCLPLLAGVLSFTGCVIEHGGPPQHEFQAIERDKSDRLHATLHMGAGKLRVSGGTDKLARADFAYSVPAWKPVIDYHTGSLTISQPENSGHAHFDHSTYEWDLRLTREVPVDLIVHFGAGEARLDLGTLDLRRVEVHMGVGELDLDLRGNPKHSYDVEVHGGVGEATVRVPNTAAVEADAAGGIGEIRASGFHRDGNRYYNDATGDSKVKIHLAVHGGIGSIHLISD